MTLACVTDNEAKRDDPLLPRQGLVDRMVDAGNKYDALGQSRRRGRDTGIWSSMFSQVSSVFMNSLWGHLRIGRKWVLIGWNRAGFVGMMYVF